MSDLNLSPEKAKIIASVLADDLTQKVAVHMSPPSEVIIIRVETVELILERFEGRLGIRDRWIAPLSIAATLLICLLTTTFQDAFTIKAATWQALFLVGFVASIIWLVRTLLALRQAATIAQVMQAMKQGGPTDAAKPK